MKLNEALFKVMLHLRNAFERDSESGTYEIQNGTIALQGEYGVGEWIAIVGSRLNGGVYVIKSEVANVYVLGNGTYDETPTKSEIFDGTIYRLAIPRMLLNVCEDIRNYKPPTAGGMEVTSESVLGMHSVTYASKDGRPLTWVDKFGKDLEQWREQFQTAAATRIFGG